MTDNGKYEGLMGNKLEDLKNQLGSRISSKLIPTNPNDETATLVDAFNIDWEGYKLGDNEFKYTTDLLSYIDAELNAKISSSGNVWDDIKDSAYMTTQINIYTSSSSKSDAPNIVWQNQIATSYDNMTSYSTLPANWVTSIPNIAGNDEYVWMSAIYKVTSLANITLGFHGPSSTPIYLSSESGIQGNFKSTVFTRTNTTPIAPDDGALYDTGLPKFRTVKDNNNNAITYNGGTETCMWCDGIPASNSKEIIWASSAIITDSTPNETVWTTPRPMSDTDTYDVEFSASTNIVPTNTDWDPDHATTIWVDPGTRKYRDGSNYNGDFHEMLWRAEREMQNGSPLGPWVITKIVGEQGEPGIKGPFVSTVFKRSETQPNAPASSEGTYNNPIPNGWTDGTPSGPGALWSTWKTFTASSDNNGEWATPQLVADTDNYDVEFSPNTIQPNDPSTMPSAWIDPTTNHYKDHTEQNPHVYEGSWEDMIWRAERIKEPGEAWNNQPWVITKIKGENGMQGKPADYYEQLWKNFVKNTEPSTWTSADLPQKTNPDDNNIQHYNDWSETMSFETNKRTYMTSRKVVCSIQNNNIVKNYSGNWTTPMPINAFDGIDGVANPIHPVLLYTWHTSYNDGTENCWPSYTASSENPGANWHESPGNPSGNNIYLWMIQGERHNNHMLDLDDDNITTTPNSYWSSAVCLSGTNGEPGADGDDIEFIYRRYETVPEYPQDVTDEYDYPYSWTTSTQDFQQDDYLGVEELNYDENIQNKWEDHPQGVTSIYKYEYCSYRRKTGPVGNKTWGEFSVPFAWSIFGENGLDGDGTEYIYTTLPCTTGENYEGMEYNLILTSISTSTSNFNDSQNSEWGVNSLASTKHNVGNKPQQHETWHDDPQIINADTQRYQYYCTRKYKQITQTNYTSLISNADSALFAIDISTGIISYNNISLGVKVGDKAWFPYSSPKLWNWFTNDGTDAPRLVMIYTRNSDISNAPSLPVNAGSGQTTTYQIPNTNLVTGVQWTESPTNASGNNTYLWMTSNYYSGKDYHPATTHNPESWFYEVTDNWQTPVCLTGNNGKDGEDGTDIEFIYFRTSEDNYPFDNDGNNIDPNTLSADQTEDYPCNVTTVDDISYYDPEHIYTGEIYSYMLHDVWTDNPLGVTSEYDYEWCAIRKKVNKSWETFCKPFLWSKYGEDGVDGDGVEYIFFRSADTSEVSFSGNNDPSTWDCTTATFQESEYRGNDYNSGNVTPWWTDNPSGVLETNAWEYVSTRKKRTITDNNKTDFIAAWPQENSTYTVGSGNNAITYKVGDKVWFPYSTPALWSKWAFDAIASNLTLETDNDMMAVAVDGSNNTRSESTNTANIYLYHNISIVSSSWYDLEFVESNYANCQITTDTTLNDTIEDANTNQIAHISKINNVWNVSVTIPNDIALPNDGAFTFNIKATVKNDDDNNQNNENQIPVEIRGQERFYTIKVIGLSLSTIYQLKTDTIVVKRDINNTAIPSVINPSIYNISDINDTINAGQQLPDGFFVFVRINDGNKPTIYGSPCFTKVAQHGSTNYLLSNLNIISTYNKIEFNLIYTNNSSDLTFISNITNGGQAADLTHTWHATLVDKEIISVVYDGLQGDPGVDSKAQEYIYMLTSDIDFFENTSLNDYYKPQNWNNTNVDDYPFDTSSPTTNGGISYVKSVNNISGNGIIDTINDLAIAYWTDNPQGVSDEYPYEWWSTRSYDTSNEVWESFSKPVIRANWGHSGEDGDGVEYIYYLTNSSSPAITSYFYADYSEYLGENTGWTDNPTGVGPTNKNEFVAVRKYKRLSYIDLKQYVYNFLTNAGTCNTTAYNAIENDDSILTQETYNTIYEAIGNTNYGTMYSRTAAGQLLYNIKDSLKNNSKHWSQYSSPKLWAKYGEKGDTGDTGGSGFTFDFTNDTLQLTVNSKNNNGLSSIKGDNFSYTKFNLYQGSSLINYSQYSLTASNNPLAGVAGKTNNFKLGYIFKHVNSTNTYYTCDGTVVSSSVLGPYRPGNVSGWDNGYYFYIKTVEGDNLTDDKIFMHDSEQIQFTVSYNGSNYNKSIGVTGLHYGVDGESAETFELMIPNSEIKYDQQGNANPDTITAQILHRTGHIAEIISYDTLKTDYRYGNTITWNISYELTIINNSPGNSGSGGSSGEIGSFDTTITYSSEADISSHDPEIEDMQILPVKFLTWKLWMNSTCVDIETTYAVYDGSNGRDGYSEEFIYSITYNTTGSNATNPATWYNESQAIIYTQRDWIPSTQQSDWFDSPQGVDSTNTIEWVSQRTWNYEGSYWNPYQAPIKWAHYGKDGKDGDGVEYIYYKTTTVNKTFTGNENPKNWTGDSDFQTTEYIRNSQTEHWKDNPQGVSQANEYEYVSIRKYKQYDELSQNITSINKSGDSTSFRTWVTNKLNANDLEGFELSGPSTLTGNGGFISLRVDYLGATWYTNHSDIKQLTDELYNFALIYNVINGSENGNNLQEILQQKYWMPYSEPSLWSSNVPGADSVILDFTNDQVNLAVSSTGNIKPGQTRSTVLKVINIGTKTISSVVLSSASLNHVTVNPSSGTSANTNRIKLTYTKYSTYVDISLSSAGNWGIQKQIPEQGIEIEFIITLSDSTTLTKKLNVCGQHNGEDGDPAVTYEIIPTVNAIYKNGTTFTPSSISYIVNKYDGDSISEVPSSGFSNSFYAKWGKWNDGSAESAAIGASTVAIQNVPYGNSSSSAIGVSDISYINLELISNNKVIDRETIPIVSKGDTGSQGEPGSQGFTGPIVRMRGQAIKNSNTHYGNGEYNKSSTGNKYDGVSPLYKDIVTYTWANGTTKYYTPKTGVGGTYIGTSTTYLCTGSYYVANTWPANPDGTLNGKWTVAQNFDFIATKLLYADQALINQISTHDLIATKQNGYPVAGITSGSKVMKDKEGNNILSPLNPNNSNNPISSTITNSGSSDNPTLSSGDTDGSSVRIFAGEIKKGNNYSLTYAPFNVRQDGTAYMTKAVVTGDITANTLSLGTGSFAYISSTDPQTVTLPALEDKGKTKSFYILSDYTSSSSNYRIRCKNSDETMNVSVGDDTPGHSSGNYWYIYPKKNRFYQCISVGKTWNIIINELTQATQGVEYQYIDVTKDVQLFGYKYENSNVKIIPYTSQIENDTDIAFGPYLTDNGTSIDIEFFTYLDTSHYGTSTSDYALADFGEFYWMTEGTN